MTAKEYLSQYLNAEREIKAKLEEISRLRALATNITQVLCPDPVQTSPENKLEIIIGKIVDMEREVDADIDRLQKMKQEVVGVIKTVDDKILRVLLYYKYLKGASWKAISKAIGHTESMTKCKLHPKALSQITQNIALGLDR